jgi:hypothetical protein
MPVSTISEQNDDDDHECYPFVTAVGCSGTFLINDVSPSETGGFQPSASMLSGQEPVHELQGRQARPLTQSVFHRVHHVPVHDGIGMAPTST